MKKGKNDIPEENNSIYNRFDVKKNDIKNLI